MREVLTAHAEVLEQAVTEGAICVELHQIETCITLGSSAQVAITLVKADSGKLRCQAFACGCSCIIASVQSAYSAQAHLSFQALHVDQEVDDVAVREVGLGDLSMAHLVGLRHTADSSGALPGRQSTSTLLVTLQDRNCCPSC